MPLRPVPHRVCPECGNEPDNPDRRTPWPGIALMAILCLTAIVITWLITTR